MTMKRDVRHFAGSMVQIVSNVGRIRLTIGCMNDSERKPESEEPCSHELIYRVFKDGSGN
jgi:hypothetical protein